MSSHPSHPQHGSTTPTRSDRPPSSSTTTSSSSTNTNNPQQGYHHLSHEERLGKVWRHLASSIVGLIGKAEKAGSDPTPAHRKELDESVLSVLRTRMEWHRLMSHVEARLQGKAQEMEALDCYVRTQPRLGRKRKRPSDNDEPVASSTEATTTETATTAAPADITVDIPAQM